MKLRLLFLSCISILLCACLHRYSAPVYDVHKPRPPQRSYKGMLHRVGDGETVFSIAFTHNLDYHALARWNQLPENYAIQVGQYLRLSPSPGELASKPKPVILPVKGTISTVYPSKVHEETEIAVKQWQWPCRGRILAYYNEAAGNKGIDIAGRLNNPIRATANGEVVYSGSGIRGYGNLLIIKHNEQFLSAYAHNQTLLVHEGQWVKAGDVVATMGQKGKQGACLHFEIRKMGKPVNPLHYVK